MVTVEDGELDSDAGPLDRPAWTTSPTRSWAGSTAGSPIG